MSYRTNRGMGRVLPMLLLAVFGIVTSLPVYAAAQKYPNVLAAKVQVQGTNSFNFAVTISSPYDTPQRYADGYRIINRDGTVYGMRKLRHDHAGEQPFTRGLRGVKIPSGVRNVVIQARDQKYGYGGKTLEVTLPGR